MSTPMCRLRLLSAQLARLSWRRMIRCCSRKGPPHYPDESLLVLGSRQAAFHFAGLQPSLPVSGGKLTGRDLFVCGTGGFCCTNTDAVHCPLGHNARILVASDPTIVTSTSTSVERGKETSYSITIAPGFNTADRKAPYPSMRADRADLPAFPHHLVHPFAGIGVWPGMHSASSVEE
jgi:hypothetical protein